MTLNHDVQKDFFLKVEADQWFLRNKEKISNPRNDILSSELQQLQRTPKKVLEVGCSNGWRLEHLRSIWSCDCHGVEPSFQAIEDAKRLFPNINIEQGTADQLPFDREQFDLVIIGFCGVAPSEPDRLISC